MPFEISGRFFFLTYAQCPITQDELYQHLNTLRPLHRAVIVREQHEDGEPHLHASLEFSTRLQSRNPRYFDIGQHHPNVQRVRTWGACVNYCRKDGGDQTRYYGCTPENATEQSSLEGETFDAVAQCEAQTTQLAWLGLALKNAVPYGYAEALWRLIHGRQAPTYEHNVFDGVIEFNLDSRHWHPTYRTLCILGPSGCGKTSWALRECPIPFLLVTDIDDLRDYDPKVHQAIVFDEIRCTGDEYGKGKWPLTSQIKLTTWDTPVSIRIRYTVARIPAHVPKIFTCTDSYPFTKDTQITRRVKFINLYNDADESNRWI